MHNEIQLKSMYNLACEKAMLAQNKVDMNLSRNQYELELSNIWKDAKTIYHELRLVKTPTLLEIKNGEHMLFTKFVDLIIDGKLSDDNVYGYYATNNMQSNVLVYPSDIKSSMYRIDFTHVVIFNK